MKPPNEPGEGESLRDAGMEKARIGNEEFIDRLQLPLIRIAQERGEVSADDANDIADELNIAPSSTNAKGSIFKRHPYWEFVRHGRSRRKKRHAGVTAFWRYKDTGQTS